MLKLHDFCNRAPEPAASGEARREAGLATPQSAGERLRHAWGLIWPYWVSRDWKFAWGAMAVLLAFNFGYAYFLYWQNGWQRRLFDAIEARQISAFWTLMGLFALVYAISQAAVLLNEFFRNILGLRWRLFLNDRYLTAWLDKNRFYEIERARVIDNPDQRIQEDIQLFADGTVKIVTFFLSSIANAVGLTIALLAVAEPIRFMLLNYQVVLPADVVWYAYGYAICGTAFVVWVGRALIKRVMRQQHYEANYRFGLVHVRRNAEQIAFADAIPAERRSLVQAVDNIRDNFYRLTFARLRLLAAKDVYDLGAVWVVPLLVAGPKYFAGTIGFGGVMSIRDGFQRLGSALGMIQTSYESLATLIAYTNRLKALDDALYDPRPRGVSFGYGPGAAMTAKGLSITLPDGQHLVDVDDWRVAPGERWVISGASGGGKSTLLRAIAGLWPNGAGSVVMPATGTTMFVPQRLYLPLGTLKDAVCFPDPPEAHGDDVIAGLLTRVGLGKHASAMHNLRAWADELSPGEQQRLGLARVLLQRPDRLILDEATSALDPANARFFYDTLCAELPELTLVSVVHSEGLFSYHSNSLTIDGGRARVAKITTEPKG